MQEPSPGVQWPRDWNHLPAVTAKQRLVLELRFGLKDGIEHDYEDIAQMLGMSKQAVHRLEKRAFARLRKGLGVDN